MNKIQIAHRQDNVFKNLKEKKEFVTLTKQLAVNKSTRNFKVNISKLVSQYIYN